MLGLVADDLTGAGDASVQFAKRGWSTFLTFDVRQVRLKPDTTDAASTDAATPTPAASPTTVVSGFSRTVIAVTTDCRALSNDGAERRTSDAVAALMTAGIDRLFLKVDSTMRGSVPGQVTGALVSWQTRYPDARAIFCPAYPAMGRTVESNRLLVRGEPVDRTAFGCDPVNPVTTSDMSALLPPSPRIRVFDAATDADLMAIAASIAAAGRSAIAVGSGGLAGALSEIWSARLLDGRSVGKGGQPGQNFIPKRKRPRVLLQVSSLNPVSRTQVMRLKAVFPDVVVLLAPAERGDRAVVAERLAREFVEQVKREQWDMLGLIGGDGAREALAQLGASGIRIVDALLEGIPLGIVVGGHADGNPVFTKAGGFGAEDALVCCVERMIA